MIRNWLCTKLGYHSWMGWSKVYKRDYGCYQCRMCDNCGFVEERYVSYPDMPKPSNALPTQTILTNEPTA